MNSVHVGIDVGTTNITLVAYELHQKEIPSCLSMPNRRLFTDEAYAYAQDPHAIEQSVRTLLKSIKQPIASISVTGQVHGILYYNKDGKGVSPLYTWLDQRAMQAVDGITSQQLLYEKTGELLPSGYGLLAHYANRRLGKVPPEAVGFCGILEYITSRLIGSPITRSDPSCLGTYGAFDPVTQQFDQIVLNEVLGSKNGQFLEASLPFSIAGYTPEGVPVTFPVGDNQAGVFGMVSAWQQSALISIGTSGQISLFSTSSECPPSMELRPFLEQGFLHVGATLTAGKAYETLEKFLLSVCEAAGIEVDDEQVFTFMKNVSATGNEDNPLVVDTRFSGSRKDPSIRGSIQNIGLDNFNLGNLVLGTVDGIIKELHDFSIDSAAVFKKVESIVATGSSVRKNILFTNSLTRQFQMPVRIAQIDDGAGFGIALIGAVATHAMTLETTRAVVHAMLGT